MAKNDRRRFLYNALKHENDNIKALWALINRTKGIVKKCVEDTTEQKFSTEAMAQHYVPRHEENQRYRSRRYEGQNKLRKGVLNKRSIS